MAQDVGKTRRVLEVNEAGRDRGSRSAQGCPPVIDE